MSARLTVSLLTVALPVQFLHRLPVAECGNRPLHWRSPPYRVFEHLLNLRLVEYRERLMPWPEVEHLAAPVVAASLNTAAISSKTSVSGAGRTSRLNLHLDVDITYTLSD